MKSAVFVVLCLAIAAMHAFQYTGYTDTEIPCPSQEFQQANCQNCTCNKESYTCYGCPKIPEFRIDNATCYLQRDLTKPHPECCVPEIICQGFPGFNQSMIINDIMPNAESTNLTEEEEEEEV